MDGSSADGLVVLPTIPTIGGIGWGRIGQLAGVSVFPFDRAADRGELLIGATAEEMGFDVEPTAGAVLDLLRHAWELLPGIYDLELAEINVGLRPALMDHLPAIGPTGAARLFLALGHFRHGILLAPASAHYLAELLHTGEAQEVLKPFLPQRLTMEETV